MENTNRSHVKIILKRSSLSMPNRGYLILFTAICDQTARGRNPPTRRWGVSVWSKYGNMRWPWDFLAYYGMRKIPGNFWRTSAWSFWFISQFSFRLRTSLSLSHIAPHFNSIRSERVHFTGCRIEASDLASLVKRVMGSAILYSSWTWSQVDRIGEQRSAPYGFPFSPL